MVTHQHTATEGTTEDTAATTEDTTEVTTATEGTTQDTAATTEGITELITELIMAGTTQITMAGTTIASKESVCSDSGATVPLGAHAQLNATCEPSFVSSVTKQMLTSPSSPNRPRECDKWP